MATWIQIKLHILSISLDHQGSLLQKCINFNPNMDK